MIQFELKFRQFNSLEVLLPLIPALLLCIQRRINLSPQFSRRLIEPFPMFRDGVVCRVLPQAFGQLSQGAKANIAAPTNIGRVGIEPISGEMLPIRSKAPRFHVVEDCGKFLSVHGFTCEFDLIANK